MFTQKILDSYKMCSKPFGQKRNIWLNGLSLFLILSLLLPLFVRNDADALTMSNLPSTDYIVVVIDDIQVLDDKDAGGGRGADGEIQFIALSNTGAKVQEVKFPVHLWVESAVGKSNEFIFPAGDDGFPLLAMPESEVAERLFVTLSGLDDDETHPVIAALEDIAPFVIEKVAGAIGSAYGIPGLDQAAKAIGDEIFGALKEANDADALETVSKGHVRSNNFDVGKTFTAESSDLRMTYTIHKVSTYSGVYANVFLKKVIVHENGDNDCDIIFGIGDNCEVFMNTRVATAFEFSKQEGAVIIESLNATTNRFKNKEIDDGQTWNINQEIFSGPVDSFLFIEVTGWDNDTDGSDDDVLGSATWLTLTPPPYLGSHTFTKRVHGVEEGDMTVEIEVTYSAPQPNANSNGTYETTEGTAIRLSGSSNAIKPTYYWDFDNDGNYDDAVGAAPVFTGVKQDGSYPVSLKVVDTYGRSAYSNTTVTVRNLAPELKPLPNIAVFEDEIEEFNLEFSDAGVEDQFDVVVDWGDGQSENLAYEFENGVGNVPTSHEFSDPGTRFVSFTITDDSNGVSTVSFTVIVYPRLLKSSVFGQRADWTVDIGARVQIEGSVGGNGRIAVSSYTTVCGDLISNGGHIQVQENSVVCGLIESPDAVVINNAHIRGDIVAGGDVSVWPESVVAQTITSSGDIVIREGAIVSETVQANTPVTLSKASTPLVVFDFEAAADMENTVIAGWEDEHLNPGIYGRLIVNNGGEVRLSSGEYTFSSLELRRNALMHFDFSNGPIIINVAGHMHTEQGVQMLVDSSTGDATDVMFRAAKNVTLGNKGSYLGTYLAPGGQINLGSHSTLEGALYGNVVMVDMGAAIIGNPALDLFAELYLAP